MVKHILQSLANSSLRILFVFSLCLFSLLYGVIAGEKEFFPQPQLSDAKSAVKALFQILEEEKKEEEKSTVAVQTTPFVQNHAGIDDGVLMLVSGGPGYLESYNPDGGCVAWLMDRKGEIRHVWKYKPKRWAELERVSTVPGASEIYPMDVHLLSDGGLLVCYQGLNTFPFGVGMARLDKDSNTVWKKECLSHHWFTVTPDEKIVTPTVRILKSPQPIGNTSGRLVGEDGLIIEDVITVMSLDGEILEEISMLDAINKSGLVGIYQGSTSRENGRSPDAITWDPLHLNSVQLIGEKVAAAYDWLNADDFLVSFRNVNTIGIIDRATSVFKWRSTGLTLRQHNPRFIGTEHVLVFDNLGGDVSLGGSRLLKIGIKTRKAETIFPTDEDSYAGKVFSQTAGHIDINRDENAILMTDTRQGTLLEIGLDKRDVLWEYHFADEPGKKTDIYTAKYCYDVSFEMNQTERAK